MPAFVENKRWARAVSLRIDDATGVVESKRSPFVAQGRHQLGDRCQINRADQRRSCESHRLSLERPKTWISESEPRAGSEVGVEEFTVFGIGDVGRGLGRVGVVSGCGGKVAGCG